MSYASRGLPSRLAAAPVAAEAPIEIEGLEMQYEDEICQALQKLKESQAAEYAQAKELLLSQKKVVLQQCQLLKTVQQEFSKQTPRSKPQDTTREPVRPAVQQTFDLSMDNLMNQFGRVQEEREVFQSMLAISNGFGQVSKDYLRKHFNWPSQDSSVGHWSRFLALLQSRLCRQWRCRLLVSSYVVDMTVYWYVSMCYILGMKQDIQK